MKKYSQVTVYGETEMEQDKDGLYYDVDEVDSMISEIKTYISAPFGNPEDKLTLVKETINKHMEEKVL